MSLFSYKVKLVYTETNIFTELDWEVLPLPSLTPDLNSIDYYVCIT